MFNADSNRGISILRATYDDCREDALPDLTLASDDIAFEGRGRTVTITATVRNVGAGDAGPVQVRFEGASSGLIGTVTLAAVPAAGSAVAAVEWDTAGVGSEEVVTVTVDPDGLVAESGTAPNQATATWSRRPV